MSNSNGQRVQVCGCIAIIPYFKTQVYNYFVIFLLLDIDECAVNTHDCDLVATCTNTVGNFTCACNEGYTGNGKSCSGMSDVLSSFILLVSHANVYFVPRWL